MIPGGGDGGERSEGGGGGTTFVASFPGLPQFHHATQTWKRGENVARPTVLLGFALTKHMKVEEKQTLGTPGTIHHVWQDVGGPNHEYTCAMHL